MIKEKPIIFSTTMVEGILEGRKTMTRRVIKPQPALLSTSENLIIEYGKLKRIWRGAMSLWQSKTEGKPKYNIGDVLWVREAWRVSLVGTDGEHEWANIVYKCGENKTIDINSTEKSLFYTTKAKWQSPLFLPREAARILLEVKSVRVERLRDISEKDAIAEGVKPSPIALCDADKNCIDCANYYYNKLGDNKDHKTKDVCAITATENFAELWDSLNAKRGYSWKTNPWVFVYTFTFKKLDIGGE